MVIPASVQWCSSGGSGAEVRMFPSVCSPTQRMESGQRSFHFLIVSVANQHQKGWKESQLMGLRDHDNGNLSPRLCGFSCHPEITIFPFRLHWSTHGYCFRLLVRWGEELSLSTLFSPKPSPVSFHLSWKRQWKLWTFRRRSLQYCWGKISLPLADFFPCQCTFHLWNSLL